jgi:hypothetical protein
LTGSFSSWAAGWVPHPPINNARMETSNTVNVNLRFLNNFTIRPPVPKLDFSLIKGCPFIMIKHFANKKTLFSGYLPKNNPWQILGSKTTDKDLELRPRVFGSPQRFRTIKRLRLSREKITRVAHPGPWLQV